MHPFKQFLILTSAYFLLLHQKLWFPSSKVKILLLIKNLYKSVSLKINTQFVSSPFYDLVIPASTSSIAGDWWSLSTLLLLQLKCWRLPTTRWCLVCLHKSRMFVRHTPDCLYTLTSVQDLRRHNLRFFVLFCLNHGGIPTSGHSSFMTSLAIPRNNTQPADHSENKNDWAQQSSACAWQPSDMR